MSSDKLPDFVCPQSPAEEPNDDAPDLMHALEDGMLTIANPEDGDLGRWIRSDVFVEVERDE